MKYMIVIKATKTIPNIPYFFICRFSFRELVSFITCMAYRKVCRHVSLGILSVIWVCQTDKGVCVFTPE